MYQYRAKVTRIRDGDTIEVDLDLGLYVHIHVALRLRDVDTPELVGVDREAGLDAKAYLEDIIPVGEVVVVHTFKRVNSERYVQTFDRFVADVFTLDGVDVNGMMRRYVEDVGKGVSE